MAIKRKTIDPFGMSLLDVLSNALGGVILLMLIVAATLKGNDKRRLNLPAEGEQGEIYTVLDFKLLPVNLDLDILIVQVHLDEKGKLSLEGADNKNVSINTKNGQDWLIIQADGLQPDWKVILQPTGEKESPQQASILANWNGLPVCSQTVQIDKTNRALLRVSKGEQQPEILFWGRSCLN